MSNAVLEATGLAMRYRSGPAEVAVLSDVSLRVGRAESVAILGPSGAGKTTLLNLLGGLEVPEQGRVIIDGIDLYACSAAERDRLRNRKLGFVYQLHHLLNEFSAEENVAMPLLIGGMAARRASAEARQMLASVGLEARVAHKPAELSGGERQRVALARALVTRPACILADEPTGNLDQATAAEVQALMRSLNRETGTSFVVVTHDLELAGQLDRRLLLRDGTLSGAA